MAWEDRTPEEQADAARAAEAYAATDDDHTYDVTTAKGTRLVAHGINSARVLAGKGGTYRRKDGQ
ncbi:hypothetical protein [Plantactinospora sp. CA-290183]|uniref:hypothetical protein n=1 Tax=Plantactinospora sp. CA-290183 TaxID=3240006 RepID=UPI003D8AC1FB